MGMFGCGKPKIYYLYPDDPANLNANYTLPDPSTIKPSWDPVRHKVRTRDGNIHIRHLGFRFSVEFSWINMSTAAFSEIIKMANWTGGLLLQPHTDQTLINFNVSIEIKHGYPKNKITEVDSVVVKFSSLTVGNILDYDNLINVQEGWNLDDQPTLSESNLELLTNGDFDDWTGDDPDGWALTVPEDANNYITENPVDSAQIVSDNGIALEITQTILTASSEYLLEINQTVITSGQLQALIGLTYVDIPAVVGVQKLAFTADGTKFGIRRKAACDITIASASVRKTTDTDMILTLDEIIYT